jgi:phosphoglycolate phosphatase
VKFTDKELIIFDLDGTLIDSVPDLALAINLMLESLNREPFEQEVIRGWVGNGALKLVKRAISGKREIDETLDEEFVADAHKRFLEFYSRVLAEETKTYSGVEETLGYLKSRDYYLAVVTNKPFRFVEPLLKRLRLFEFFDDFIGGDSLPSKKPSPEPLIYICEKFNVARESALMVGDSRNDIISANSAGVDSIAVTYGYNYDEDIRKHNPTAVVDRFSEIRSLL